MRGDTTSGGRRKSLSALSSGVPGRRRGHPGYSDGPPGRASSTRGVGAAGLRDEERPWPATGPGSSSGSAAPARSRAGGCDAEGRVGVRGQGSGGRGGLLGCGSSPGPGWGGLGSEAPARGYEGTRGWEREVWGTAVASRRSEAGKEAGKPPAGLSRAWRAAFREPPGSLGKLPGRDSGRGAKSSVESGHGPRQAVPAGEMGVRAGRGGSDPLAWPCPSCGGCCECFERGRGCEAPGEFPCARFWPQNQPLS